MSPGTRLVVVWTCECGATQFHNLPSGRCPRCGSEYVTTPDGRIRVLTGSFSIDNKWERV